ncbi:MAG TPA: SRPBCC family protein, partial [Beijerinckiaceae bacterium]|nr:SRPBCC family protein [Beijerinckiaceae bacterium]
MKVLAVIALILLVAIVVVLVLAARKPAGFRIERATSIKAPPDKIFALINDFRNWRAWSPWERMDPNLRRSYSGAERGEGAVYEWEGNSKVGKGRMEIVEAPP